MTNGGQIVTNLQANKVGALLKGDCLVNGVKVHFYYNPILDKFQSTSLMNSEADLFGSVGKERNWMYLICGSIAHSLKTTLPSK